MQNIVLSGGSTMFQHFGQRLKRDLKQIVDRRLETTALASGSQVKVCEGSHSFRLTTDISPDQSSGVEVDVISHKRQRYAVWFGGSLMASLVSALHCSVLTFPSNMSMRSLSSIPIATPRHSTMRSAQASADGTRSLVALHRYNYNMDILDIMYYDGKQITLTWIHET